MLHGDEDASFIHGLLEFFARDTDVGDMEFGLCELGAGKDKAPMAVRRYNAFRVSFGKVAVFALLNMIAEASSERAGKGLALFR